MLCKWRDRKMYCLNAKRFRSGSQWATLAVSQDSLELSQLGGVTMMKKAMSDLSWDSSTFSC